MKSKLLDEHAGERPFALVFETGDTVIEPLAELLLPATASDSIHSPASR